MTLVKNFHILIMSPLLVKEGHGDGREKVFEQAKLEALPPGQSIRSGRETINYFKTPRKQGND